MIHILGRPPRVVMACALPVLFLGGTGKTTLTVPMISFTDIAGREAQPNKLPKTFVVANHTANFLMIDGAGGLGKIVGMAFGGWEETRYGEYVVYAEAPPKLKAIPSIGGRRDNIPDSEETLPLRPDVLLVRRSQFADNNQRIDIPERADVKVITLDYHAMKVENHAEGTMILGQLLDKEAMAKERCDVYASALEDVYRKTAVLPNSIKHKTAYVELGNEGIGECRNSYDKDVFWGAILENFGADDPVENATQPYTPLDTELVLVSNLQFIVIGDDTWRNNAEGDQMSTGPTIDRATAQKRLKGFTTRPAWRNLAAIRFGRIYTVDRGSPRNMIDYTLTLYLAKILYPGTFQEVNPMGDMRALYAKYLPTLKLNGTFIVKYAR